MWVRKSSQLWYAVIFPCFLSSRLEAICCPNQYTLLPTNNESTFLLHNAQDLNSTYLFAMTSEHACRGVTEDLYTLTNTCSSNHFQFPFNKIVSLPLPAQSTLQSRFITRASVTFDESIRLCRKIFYIEKNLIKNLYYLSKELTNKQQIN